AVQMALAELPERQREAIALCHYHGLTNAEAARVLSIRVGAVESLLVRARRTLRVRLAPWLGGEEAEGDE
ncbi:MAG TPA: RNA polymerase sigma-70 factor, partial [Chromatiales bacterium]|nr:RNA polymerase sigma-70 factor [Chromatiales bacterium]